MSYDSVVVNLDHFCQGGLKMKIALFLPVILKLE
jgi:hypothetical protein